MLARRHDPIAAIATAPGRAAVGIVRLSGRDLRAVIDAVCGGPLDARLATLRSFRDAEGGIIDRGIALHFPAPHSYTGEDVLELQAHGGPVVLQWLLARCLQVGAGIGLRIAEPGEFTERAFLNDKLDLAQAEAVADVIDASTEAAARSAGRSLAGEFSRRIDALAAGIVRLRTLIEATLDFPEDDIDFLEQADAQGQIDRLAAALQEVQGSARQGALLRDGMTIVLAGQPNVGKSSLLNALAGAEVAIVTPIAGTTRDKVSQTLEIDGVPLHVVDTAGLRDGALGGLDEVERLGIERTWQAIASADAVLLLHDLTRAAEPGYAAADCAIAERLRAHGATRRIDVYNKVDLAAAPPQALAVSARTGRGIDDLRRALLHHVGWQAGASEGALTARARHLQAISAAGGYLAAARGHLGAQEHELAAEALRLAHRHLGEITGEFGADALLGEIFARFCIGK